MKILTVVARLTLVVAVALGSGFAVLVASAVVGHELLVLRYGPNLAAIDDTPPMQVAVLTSYLAALATGLIVLVAGCRWAVGRSRAPGPASGRPS